MQIDTIIIFATSLLFGFCAFAISYKFTVDGLQIYQKVFIRKMDKGLRNAFIFMDPRVLFLIHLASIAGMALIGYLAMGIAGLVLMVLLVSALPTLVMRIIKKRRSEQFLYQLPDCLYSMASALRAGSNLSKALEQVAKQHPAPISQEFSVILSEYKMGRKLEDSFDDMYKRIQKSELSLLNSAVSISRSVGGNLADTLDILAKTLRDTAQMEGKIKALTAMGRMQGWVVGLMPVGVAAMLFKQEPEGMRALFTDLEGWVVLGVVSILMLMAALMIRKIVNIDI